MEQRLILFAKRPRRGQVKTRLARTLGEARALALYRCFLHDQLAFLRAARTPRRDIELCLDGPLAAEDRWPPVRETIPSTEQVGEDLGQRMLAALRRTHAAGRLGLIVGADSPTLPLQRVDAAFDRLRQGAHAVIVPVDDGGYALIGTAAPCAALFTDVPWGGPGVLAATRAHARREGLELAELPPWYDIDTQRDLVRLTRDCNTGALRRRAPESCRLLARWALAR